MKTRFVVLLFFGIVMLLGLVGYYQTLTLSLGSPSQGWRAIVWVVLGGVGLVGLVVTTISLLRVKAGGPRSSSS